MPLNAATLKTPYWSVDLANFGEVVTDADDINQCINNILLTPQGSDPHRPLFGGNVQSYVDLPINNGTIAKLKAEVFTAIARWEPRITVILVQPYYNSIELGNAHIRMTIVWKLKTGSAAQTTQVLVR